MPAMIYRLRWPDAIETTCYSPSLVIQDYFTPATAYPLPEFMRKVREATQIASDRVRAKFGFACSRAADQLMVIEARAALFADHPQAFVEVVGFGDATS